MSLALPQGAVLFLTTFHLSKVSPKPQTAPTQTTFSRDFSENSQLFPTTFAFSCRFHASFNRRERSIVLTSGTRHDRAFPRTTPHLCRHKRSRLRCQTHWVAKLNPLGSKTKPIGLQNQIHWVAKSNPLGYKIKPIGF